MPTPWHGLRRQIRSPGSQNSAFAGHSERCNACGSTQRSRCVVGMARSASSRFHRPGCSRSFSDSSRPFVDLLLIVQLIAAGLDYIQHGAQFDPTNLEVTLFYYALFITVDLVRPRRVPFERRENWQLLWWLVLQRFGYRQLLYYVLAKSVTTATKGHLVGWGKLDRKATVQPGNILHGAAGPRRVLVTSGRCRFAAGAIARPRQRRVGDPIGGTRFGLCRATAAMRPRGVRMRARHLLFRGWLALGAPLCEWLETPSGIRSPSSTATPPVLSVARLRIAVRKSGSPLAPCCNQVS